MVNGPLDFLFRRPNSKDNSNSNSGGGGTDFLVHGWRLPHFGRHQNDGDRRGSDDGAWVYGIRRTPGLRDRAGGWRTTIGGPHGPLGVSPVFTTSTTTTTTEKPWKWENRSDAGRAIVRFIREHKNELVLAVGILLFLLVSICGCVCFDWRCKRRKKERRRRRQQQASRNVEEVVPHAAAQNSALQMHQLHGAMVSKYEVVF